MARRHESLIPLAKDHYEGLLLVQQLREHNRAIMTGWPKTPTDQARFVARFYDEHLKKHFEAEEQALFPPASERVPASCTIVQELLREHRTIEEEVAQFRTASGNYPADALQQSATLLEEHIRKEDRVLFPLLENEATPEVLEAMRQKLAPYYPG
ncbi:MAG TPA: hemerythrin domain-containing protein [Bacteroidota bacterium]|nr:hemerythrin domain-containing protein [Bacteroidota bacterium]